MSLNCTEVLRNISYATGHAKLEDQIACSHEFYHMSHNSPAEGIILGFSYTIGCIFALIGNGFVIYASWKYGTFKMDKVTVMFVRHLAIADSLYIIMYPIPMIFVHAYHRWVFGVLVCKFIGYAISIPGTANINFVLAVSIHRFVRCKWPMRAQLITAARAKNIVIATWLLSCTMIVYFLGFGLGVDLNIYITNCSFHFQNRWKGIHVVLMLTAVALPCAATAVINIILWCYVRQLTRRSPVNPNRRAGTVTRAANNPKKEGSREKNNALITTCAITAIFLITWAPTVIRFMITTWPAGDQALSVPPTLEKIRLVYIFGTWCNPIIYTMVNKRFRGFVFSRLVKYTLCLKGKWVTAVGPKYNTDTTLTKVSVGRATQGALEHTVVGKTKTRMFYESEGASTKDVSRSS